MHWILLTLSLSMVSNSQIPLLQKMVRKDSFWVVAVFDRFMNECSTCEIAPPPPFDFFLLISEYNWNSKSGAEPQHGYDGVITLLLYMKLYHLLWHVCLPPSDPRRPVLLPSQPARSSLDFLRLQNCTWGESKLPSVVPSRQRFLRMLRSSFQRCCF